MIIHIVIALVISVNAYSLFQINHLNSKIIREDNFTVRLNLENRRYKLFVLSFITTVIWITFFLNYFGI